MNFIAYPLNIFLISFTLFFLHYPLIFASLLLSSCDSLLQSLNTNLLKIFSLNIFYCSIAYLLKNWLTSPFFLLFSLILLLGKVLIPLEWSTSSISVSPVSGHNCLLLKSQCSACYPLNGLACLLPLLWLPFSTRPFGSHLSKSD